MDLPVSDFPVLVLQMHATKLSFYVGAEGHTLAWGTLLSQLSYQPLFILIIDSVILEVEPRAL